MHLVNCEHPKRVFNPYISEEMVVPCGHCDICLARRSSSWVNRLEMERLSHPFCVFFTLTYSDEFLPKVVLHEDINSLVNERTSEVFSFRSLGLHLPYMKNSADYIRKRGWLCVPDVRILQNFIKKIRQKIYRNETVESNKRLRYFIATEYGPTTHRIHHHGIFFIDSKWFAENAKEVIAAAWTVDTRSKDSKSLGIIDVQYVEGNASCYVAQYLNCTSNLPYIYQTKPFRPTALFSKCPSIGSLLYKTEEIEEIFNSGTTQYGMYDRRSNTIVDAPLPSSLTSRLYPKVKYFDQIPMYVRTRIYSLISENSAYSYTRFKELMFKFFPEYEEDFKTGEYLTSAFTKATDFLVRFPLDSSCREYLYKVFFDRDKDYQNIEYRRRRFYSALYHFEYNRQMFGLTVEQYLDKMVEWFSKCDMERLSEQLVAESESRLTDSLSSLMFVDTLFFKRIQDRKKRQDDIGQQSWITDDERLILSSYGWNPDKLEWFEFIDGICPEQLLDYRKLISHSHSLCEKNRKTKVKNEYISTHMSNSLIKKMYGE